MNEQEKKYVFHVDGMHCNACVLLTESELLDVPYITSAKSSLSHHTVEVVGDFGDTAPEKIASDLSEVLHKHGYTVSVDTTKKERNLSDFKFAIPITVSFFVAFIFLQKIGLVNLVSGGHMSYSTVFIVGIIASLSTCMAIVGGLLLSLSATFAKDSSTMRPQILFHVGRIVSFFVLGGVIGVLGSVFTLSTSVTFLLNLVIGIVMLVLGINLLDTFRFAQRFQLSMPKFISKHAFSVTKFTHSFTPFVVGIVTFFLPCGFTQSMQLYTLSTGSFLTGGLTMLSFALGTLPVLALISFSSVSLKDSTWSGVFFKTAGLIVILFALFNVINSLVATGIISPVFSF